MPSGAGAAGRLTCLDGELRAGTYCCNGQSHAGPCACSCCACSCCACSCCVGVSARAGQDIAGPRSVRAWGRGGDGQLGLGHTEDCASPSVVKGGWSFQRGVCMVACDDKHTAIVTGDSHEFSWSCSCYAGRLRQQILLSDLVKQDPASHDSRRNDMRQIRSGKLWL